MKRLGFILTLSMCLMAQKGFSQDDLPVKGWQNLDLKADGYFGISSEKAYQELLKKKKGKPVIVAVIDGGVDTDHQDLKNVIAINTRETPGNGKDDDKNGYVDDVKGWNFMGSSRGNFEYDNMDVVRLLRAELLKDPKSARAKELQNDLNGRLFPLKNAWERSERKIKVLNTMTGRMGAGKQSESDFRNYVYQNLEEERLLMEIVRTFKKGNTFEEYLAQLKNENQRYKSQIDYWLNIDYNPRAGNETFNEKYYGNPDSKGTNPGHGTHVAGIIAAERNNHLGVDGVASHVKIMPLRTIPAGDALDKDLANAIRYAADNGARVINMSTGKFSSTDKQLVDEAVKYAMAKGVLIVHSAGNDGAFLDQERLYPRSKYMSGDTAKAWLEVGASGFKDDRDLVAWVSNYGKNVVDVFAPGVSIYSTSPDNKYTYQTGTSMAAPVVSGLAAMLFSYYPKLSAVEVKDIIIKSVVKIDHPVLIDRTRDSIPFSETCRSGGIVNAYNAFLLAEKKR